MSFFTACAWSTLRSLLVSVAGTVLAVRLKRTLRGADGWWKSFLGLAILLPVFVPGLLVGYGYRNFSLSLVHRPAWNELAYAGLMLLMVVPVGTVILVCSPPPAVSRSAVHVARLMRAGRRTPRMLEAAGGLSLWIRSRLFAVLPAGAAMFLLVFQETEVATLMQARGWPEWTFTRLATGLPITGVLSRLALPVAIQLLAIGAAVSVVLAGATDRQMAVGTTIGTVDDGPANAFAAGAYAAAAIVCLLAVPGAFVLRGTLEGFSVLAAHPALMRQIGIALLFGVTAGLLAWLTSGWIVGRLGGRRGGTTVALVAMLPGLMGAWALGLSLAGLLHTSTYRPLDGTPLPMLIGEVLFQLPRAVLVRLLLGRLSNSTAAHSARLLAAAPDAGRRKRAAGLLWQLDTGGRVFGGMIVCYWAYMELSIPSPALLGPPGMTTAPVLLYNQMHYGQIPGLSALLFATIAAPIVCLLGMSLAARRLRVGLRIGRINRSSMF